MNRFISFIFLVLTALLRQVYAVDDGLCSRIPVDNWEAQNYCNILKNSKGFENAQVFFIGEEDDLDTKIEEALKATDKDLVFFLSGLEYSLTKPLTLNRGFALMGINEYRTTIHDKTYLDDKTNSDPIIFNQPDSFFVLDHVILEDNSHTMDVGMDVGSLDKHKNEDELVKIVAAKSVGIHDSEIKGWHHTGLLYIGCGGNVQETNVDIRDSYVMLGSATTPHGEPVKGGYGVKFKCGNAEHKFTNQLAFTKFETANKARYPQKTNSTSTTDTEAGVAPDNVNIVIDVNGKILFQNSACNLQSSGFENDESSSGHEVFFIRTVPGSKVFKGIIATTTENDLHGVYYDPSAKYFQQTAVCPQTSKSVVNYANYLPARELLEHNQNATSPESQAQQGGGSAAIAGLYDIIYNMKGELDSLRASHIGTTVTHYLTDIVLVLGSYFTIRKMRREISRLQLHVDGSNPAADIGLETQGLVTVTQ